MVVHLPRTIGPTFSTESMSHSAQAQGSVASLWRYPVKSMMGEELEETEVTERGLLGDRAYALVDRADRKVATAKNPRKWPRLFDFRAAYVSPPHLDRELPSVRITLPDGTVVTSGESELNRILSRAADREVTFDRAEPGPGSATAEEYWPDMPGLDHRDTVTDFELPQGTFFDCAVVHLLTTATLDRLRQVYPSGRFEVRRFRPNLVVETANGAKDFVENAWIGGTLAIGEAVRLSITRACARCVMTTLPQGGLPKDPTILRTAVEQNHGHVGIYASVVRGGIVRRGDAVRLE
jgi:MOSC domain-containing protein